MKIIIILFLTYPFLSVCVLCLTFPFCNDHQIFGVSRHGNSLGSFRWWWCCCL